MKKREMTVGEARQQFISSVEFRKRRFDALHCTLQVEPIGCVSRQLSTDVRAIPVHAVLTPSSRSLTRVHSSTEAPSPPLQSPNIHWEEPSVSRASAPIERLLFHSLDAAQPPLHSRSPFLRCRSSADEGHAPSSSAQPSDALEEQLQFPNRLGQSVVESSHSVTLTSSSPYRGALMGEATEPSFSTAHASLSPWAPARNPLCTLDSQMSNRRREKSTYQEKRRLDAFLD
jgi:hypothetical protein